MTVYLDAIVPLPELLTCFELFEALPDELSQIAISDGENDPKHPTTFRQLIENKSCPVDLTGGYFLHAKSATYSINTLEDASLFIECSNDDVAKILVDQFANCRVHYAFACEFDERVHQNRISVKKNYGIDEQWVGRDYKKYLPGIYWLNLVPKSMLEHNGVDINSVKAVSFIFREVGNDSYLFQLYPNSSDWLEHTKSIDAWRLNTHGVFFKKAAEMALKEASNFLEASDATREWK